MLKKSILTLTLLSSCTLTARGHAENRYPRKRHVIAKPQQSPTIYEENELIDLLAEELMYKSYKARRGAKRVKTDSTKKFID